MYTQKEVKRVTGRISGQLQTCPGIYMELPRYLIFGHLEISMNTSPKTEPRGKKTLHLRGLCRFRSVPFQVAIYCISFRFLYLIPPTRAATFMTNNGMMMHRNLLAPVS